MLNVDVVYGDARLPNRQQVPFCRFALKEFPLYME